MINIVIAEAPQEDEPLPMTCSFVNKSCRHESISTTNRYAHFGGEADAAYDEILNKK
jgi:hypothetical protein